MLHDVADVVQSDADNQLWTTSLRPSNWRTSDKSFRWRMGSVGEHDCRLLAFLAAFPPLSRNENKEQEAHKLGVFVSATRGAASAYSKIRVNVITHPYQQRIYL